jgi:UDP-N-acetylglucosamine 1-carboxyvinyltransferase
MKRQFLCVFFCLEGSLDMSQLKVTGGRPLCGRVTVSGTKNAALPILFATVLVNGVSTLRNLPAIRDVETVLSLLESMGAKVLRGDGWVQIDTTALSPLPYDPRTAELRGSLYLLGSSLSRFGEVTFGTAGGCDFGGRPYDYHIRLLEKIGCRTTYHGDRITLRAEKLQGCRILLP